MELKAPIIYDSSEKRNHNNVNKFTSSSCLSNLITVMNISMYQNIIRWYTSVLLILLIHFNIGNGLILTSLYKKNIYFDGNVQFDLF